MQARAVAHPNLALVKYWGKSDVQSNVPAVGSLSLTLRGMSTITDVRFDPALSGDVVRIGGRSDVETWTRVTRCLDVLRTQSGVDLYAHVDSTNDFPTSAGLASSASGFAALVTAAARALDMDRSPSDLEDVARLGSGSAPRSLWDGICHLSQRQSILA